MTDLATQTPAEIDTALAAIYTEAAGVHARIDAHRADADRARKTLASDDRYDYNRDYARQALARVAAALPALNDQLRALAAKAAPFEAEYTRRGGWTRAYIVRNSNGHVHRTRQCATCFTTTEFGWVTDVSGWDETAIVEAAGEMACTVCYPSAPVDVLKRKCTLQDPATRAARAERDAAKAARDAKKAAKAITNPDGTPLQVFDYVVPARERRMRDGSTVTAPAFDKYETLATAYAARQWLTDHFDTWGPTRRDADVAAVAAALAAKEGKTAEQVLTEARKRAAKRSK